MSPKYLNMNISELEQKGASFTAREIQGQPDLWQKTFQSVHSQKDEIASFLDDVFRQKDLLIILTGAGIPVFIEDVLEGPFQRNTSITSKAITTTDIVTHPKNYLPEHKQVLFKAVLETKLN